MAAYQDEVLADSPLGYWRFEETSGTTIADSSGNGRTGTLVPTTGPAGNLDFSGVSNVTDGDPSGDRCIPSSCLSLTAAADPDRVEIPDDAAWDVTAASWEAWVLLSESSTFGNMIDRDQGPGGERVFQFRIHGFSNVELIIFVGGTATGLATTGQGLHDTIWHHLVGTYDGADMRLYVDGAEVLSKAQTGDMDSGTNGLWLGRMQQGQQDFNGRLDEVAFYGSALSAARVKAHWDAAKCGGWRVGALAF